MSSTPIFSFGLPPPEAGLQALTIEYLEHMRNFCRQNGYDIQKLFEPFDPLGTGVVPDYTFLHIIRNKFWSQIGFSIDQIRVVANLFRDSLGEVSYKRLHDWMKSDENIVDQMIQIHCTCASIFPALVTDIITSLRSSCLFSPDSRPTTATRTSPTSPLGSMLSLTPISPPPPSILLGFGTPSILAIQYRIPAQSNSTGSGELENPVRFTLGRTGKPRVRKPRHHRDRNRVVGGSPSSAYCFRPFSPLNTSFTGETSVTPSGISSIFGIPEANVDETASQSSPVPATAAASLQTLFHTSGTPSETSVVWVGGGDRGHLAFQNPKYLPRNYAF